MNYNNNSVSERNNIVVGKKQKGMNMDRKENGSNSKWIYGWTLAYVISTYLYIFIPGPTVTVGEGGMKAGSNGGPLLLVLALILEFLPVIFAVLNLIVVKTQKEKISREEFLNCTILIKYGLLPLFLVGGLLALLLLLMTFIPVPFMIFIGPAGALALSFFGYIILLGSAPFSIAYLTKSKQDRTHAKGLILPAKIMQFFFVFDVISIMVLSFKEGKWRKLTIAIVTVLALIFITFCIAIGVLIIKAI